MDVLLPLEPPDRGGGEGGHPTRRIPPRAGCGDGGGWLLPLSDRKRFGVVAVQSQAGAENSVGGLAQANADNVPILALPGGNPLDMLFVRPNFFAARTWERVLKRAEVITRPDQTGNIMRRAFHALRSGRPGPVLVEMPGDVCGQPIPDNAPTYASPGPALYAPSAGAVADAARKLVDAEEPLIWAGAGVMSADATEELRALAELLDVPVYTSMPGKSAFDERHTLSVGAGGSTVAGPARQWLDACDVLFAVGTSLTATPYGSAFPRQIPDPFGDRRRGDQQGHGSGHRLGRRCQADPRSHD